MGYELGAASPGAKQQGLPGYRSLAKLTGLSLDAVIDYAARDDLRSLVALVVPRLEVQKRMKVYDQLIELERKRQLADRLYDGTW
jgi:hypothetical protein